MIFLTVEVIHTFIYDLRSDRLSEGKEGILLSHGPIKQFFHIQEGRSWREAATELKGNPPQNTKDQMGDLVSSDRREICLQIRLPPLHCLSALAFHYVRKLAFGFDFWGFVCFVVYAVKKTALLLQGTCIFVQLRLGFLLTWIISVSLSLFL